MSKHKAKEEATPHARLRDGEATDIYTREKRSEVMSRVRAANTKPELTVRSTLHRMGYRFRVNYKDLPGIPDLVLPKYKTTIFVHGCFWHQHPGCKKATLPKQNAEFWEAKLNRNQERDKEVRRELESRGWNVIVIWECEVKRGIDWMDKLVSVLKEAGL